MAAAEDDVDSMAEWIRVAIDAALEERKQTQAFAGGLVVAK